VNFQQQKLINGATGNTVAVSYICTLSKRTNFYGNYAQRAIAMRIDCTEV